jgi:hypothetical protein
VICELNIWRVANLLIRERGADAELKVARLQDLMLHRAMTRGGTYGSGSGGRLR